MTGQSNQKLVDKDWHMMTRELERKVDNVKVLLIIVVCIAVIAEARNVDFQLTFMMGI